MKAWKWLSVGAKPEFQEVEDVYETGPEEAIVSIAYSSLNHRDVWISEGKYPNIQWPCTLGSDGSGWYQDRRALINPGMNWGENERVQSNDYQILGMPHNGTFADRVRVMKKQIHAVPEHLSLEEAAAIPLAGVTAFRVLMVKGSPQPGQKILITGIGGGVALWALKFALSISCDVYVTSSSDAKLHKAKQLGATGGVNASTEGWDKTLLKTAGEFDIIIDSIMGNTLPSLVKVCKPGGKICFYGASAGITDQFSPHSIFWKQIELIGSTMGSDLDFLKMLQHIDTHKITPVIDQVYPFEKIHEAFERMKDRQQFGKIIVNHHV